MRAAAGAGTASNAGREAAETSGGLFAALFAGAQMAQLREDRAGKAKDKTLIGKLAGAAAQKAGTARAAAKDAASADRAHGGQARVAGSTGGQIGQVREKLDAIRKASSAAAARKTEAPLPEAGREASAAGKRNSAANEHATAEASFSLLAALTPKTRDIDTKKAAPNTADAAEGAVDPKASGKKGVEKDGPDAGIALTDLRKTTKRKETGRQSGTEDSPSAGARDGPTAPGKGPVGELDFDLSRAAGLAAKGDFPGDSKDSAGVSEAAPRRDFSSVLADQLRAGWNNDIVQNAQVILRDGDMGTIRLRLHPESLGGVKIELKVADNSISGKIVVESDAAKTAFERNMAQLQDAFKQGGFESARLEVQVGSGNSGSAGGAGEGPRPFWSERHGMEALGSAVPDSAGQYAASRLSQAVNLLA